MATYCLCGIVLYESREGLCSECYPLSKAKAVREDREIEQKVLLESKEKRDKKNE